MEQYKIDTNKKVTVLSTTPDKIVLANLKNKESCKNYSNCISGVFQWMDKPNAIFITKSTIHGYSSAHSWLGCPDACLIYKKDGTFDIKFVRDALTELELEDIAWAVSGVPVIQKDAITKEAALIKCGYSKNTVEKSNKIYDYTDVLRKTNHTALTVKDGMVFGLFLPTMSYNEVYDYCKHNGYEYAIMLDGGHIAAVNSDVGSVNASQKQSTIIQFPRLTENTIKTFSRKKDGSVKLSANFRVREFACRDGSDKIVVDTRLVDILQKVRDHFKKPVNITSAYRTVPYNKKIGGVDNSQHCKGYAADIYITGVTPTKIASYLETLLINTGGIGVYKGFVHVDVRTKRARW